MLSLCVCMCMYVCMCVYICVYMCVCIYVCMCMCVYVYECVCMYMNVCVSACALVTLWIWSLTSGLSSQYTAGSVEGGQNNDLVIGSMRLLDSVSHRDQSSMELYGCPMLPDSLVGCCPTAVLGGRLLSGATLTSLVKGETLQDWNPHREEEAHTYCRVPEAEPGGPLRIHVGWVV